MLKRALITFLALALASACGDIEKNKRTPKPDSAGLTAGSCKNKVGLKSATLSEAKIFKAQLSWKSPLVDETMINATLSFSDGGDCPAKSVEDVVFNPTMPTMGGHGTKLGSLRIQADKNKPNQDYDLEGVFFTMEGPWEIDVSATVNGKRDTAYIWVDVAE